MDSDQHTVSHIRTEIVEAAGISDKGMVRPDNQDAIHLDASGRFLLLADGMGGHDRGSEASVGAIDIIRRHLRPERIADRSCDITEGSGVPAEIVCLLSLVEDAVQEANAVLYRRNRSEQLRRYMGTTVVGIVIPEGEHLLWFHIGDSRLYRLRDGQLTQLTADHSAHIEWERSGRRGAEPGRNVITRAIGPNPSVSPDTYWDKRRPDDVYLLCSDGLTDMISDRDIARILLNGQDLPKTASRLIAAALNAGGRDNASVVLCRL